MQYRFTGELPLVLGEYSHGRNALVTRADGADTDDLEGSTIVLRPGDLVDVDEPIVHALLEDVDGPPATPYDHLKKPELLDLVKDRELEVPARADKPTLIAALVAQDVERQAANAPDPGPAVATIDAPDLPGAGEAPEVPTPQAGADGADEEAPEGHEQDDDPAAGGSGDPDAGASGHDQED